MKKLYKKILEKGVSLGVITSRSKILVVAGGPNDSNTLNQLGFKNVLISNLAPHGNVLDYTPFQWKKANLNNLDFSDESFDYVIVSAALHHLYSPHRGFGEMLRIAKEGIIVIESCDNFFSKIARKLKIVPDYEIDAILTDGKGGVENSHVPNFIYRWTRSEVVKTTNSYLPHVTNTFYFFNNYEFPIERLKRTRNFLIRCITPFLFLFITFCKYFLPKQANEFGFLILKGKTLKPWLKGNLMDPQLDLDYLRRNYITKL